MLKRMINSKITWVLTILLAFIYLNNSSTLFIQSHKRPFLLAHRGIGQTFPMDGITGETNTAERIYKPEHPYLENDIVTGFMKPYKDNKYVFVALLPKKNIFMSDLLESLDAKAVMSLVENKKDEVVYAKIPKFSVEYDTLLNEPLQGLGILDAFDPYKADFTGLGKSMDGNIFVSRVIHKTRIDVDEKGTKAGAVTAVETSDSAMEEPKEVILDRPFFYMIVDTEQNLPLFMGSLMSVN